ncbi:hypothetical protein [Mediterraneibacter gnavus]|jgi:hypothetical protein|uniref:hypothetical protein n=1 Tax=Mediterraneibacter gnavus TaxID=33038 RepID=UPI002330D372|nr:hypothetical protein [Mediterraneibacter gnavus]
MKHYLFWEKQSIKEFWEKGLFMDKVFMITYSILMLFFFVAFIVMSLSTVHYQQECCLVFSG